MSSQTAWHTGLFRAVQDLAEQFKLELAIFDWNGVLDSQDVIKRRLLEKVSPEMSVVQINEVLVSIERNFDQNKTLSFEANLVQTLAESEIAFSFDNAREFVKQFYSESSRNLSVFEGLAALHSKIHVCIYTSASLSSIPEIADKLKAHAIQIFDRTKFIQEKPSLKNLQKICEEMGTTTKRVVMIGDGPSVDLMPAKLLGMHTVLVNAYVDSFINSSIVDTIEGAEPIR